MKEEIRKKVRLGRGEDGQTRTEKIKECQLNNRKMENDKTSQEMQKKQREK
jgi:hypothetical protein